GCGARCTTGVCVRGACGCQLGWTPCAGRCVNFQNDPANCGACGNACPPGVACASGTCAACPAGYVRCNGLCVLTATDGANCGGCGIACGAHAACSSGQCRCNAGYTLCGGRCVPLL